MVTRKYDQIDSLRFLAVFGVLSAHWSLSIWDFLNKITIAGRGVDLFFAISGFLITLGLIRAKESNVAPANSLYKFYIRRALRIFPLYYLTVFILFCFYFHQMLPVIGWYLLYLCNFHIIKMQDWGIAGHFWSLSVEEQFYLVWPFIILLVPNKRLPLVMAMSIGISIAAKSYWYATPTDFWSAYVNPLAALDVLAFGALLSYLYYFHNEWLKKILYNPFTGAIVALQVMVCIYCDGVLHSKFAHIIAIRPSFGLFSIWLIGRAAFGFRGITGYILNSRALRYIGKISYAIYLFHPFVPGILEKVKYPQEENLRFIMYAVVAMGAASISWYLFESRILKFKERFE